MCDGGGDGTGWNSVVELWSDPQCDGIGREYYCVVEVGSVIECV